MGWLWDCTPSCFAMAQCTTKPGPIPIPSGWCFTMVFHHGPLGPKKHNTAGKFCQGRNLRLQLVITRGSMSWPPRTLMDPRSCTEGGSWRSPNSTAPLASKAAKMLWAPAHAPWFGRSVVEVIQQLPCGWWGRNFHGPLDVGVSYSHLVFDIFWQVQFLWGSAWTMAVTSVSLCEIQRKQNSAPTPQAHSLYSRHSQTCAPQHDSIVRNSELKMSQPSASQRGHQQTDPPPGSSCRSFFRDWRSITSSDHHL